MRFSLAPTLVIAALAATGTIAVAQIGGTNASSKTTSAGKEPRSPDGKRYLSQPLVTSIYTADPSAHVFGGKIYVYPSHDIDVKIADDDLGNQYAMRDYRVLSMDRIGGPVKVNGVALDVKDVPWASQ
ncbi:MAG: alpha-N-arabinofuranosidase, partial [Sphingomonas sp.]